MKRLITGCVLAATLAVPTAASAHDKGSIEHKNSYLRTKVAKLTGDPHGAGRNIVRDGVRENGKPRKAKPGEVDRYFATMRRMITPPPAPKPSRQVATRVAASAVSTPAPSSASSAPAPAPSGGGYVLPQSVIQCESGGNPKAVNHSNPNRPAGAYQIITDTWIANGGGKYAPTADQAPLSAQHEVAKSVLRTQGRGAWEC